MMRWYVILGITTSAANRLVSQEELPEVKQYLVG
jgi:hypothetical protein